MKRDLELQNDLFELAHASIMRACLDKTQEPAGVVAPTENFDAFCSAMMERAERALYSLPRAERLAYLLERARLEVEWQRKFGAPNVLLLRTEAWLERLTLRSVPGASARAG